MIGRIVLAVAALSVSTALLSGCNSGEPSQSAAEDRQREIEEGNKKLGNVEGTQE